MSRAPRRRLLSIADALAWKRCFATPTLLMVLGVAMHGAALAAPTQTHNTQHAAAQGSQVFGYTDDAGVTCLTNLAPSAHDGARYQVIVAGEAPKALPASLPASLELRQWVSEAAQQENVDSALIYAVMAVESGFNSNATSNKGAAGLMQLMPATASLYGVSDRFDGRSSILGGARYLHDLLAVFGNKLPLAIAAYNSGENAVHQYHDQVPPYAETQSYVPRVLAMYHRLGGEKD